jgi:hypothetical protein
MRAVGDQRGEGVALYKLALLFERQGDLDRAEDYHRQSLQLSIVVQAPQDIADSYAYLGEFLITRRQKRDEGCAMLTEAARLYEQLGLAARAGAVREAAQRLGCA